MGEAGQEPVSTINGPSPQESKRTQYTRETQPAAAYTGATAAANSIGTLSYTFAYSLPHSIPVLYLMD
jgi:hypothetical protein